jgi:hypothetical protein
MSLIAFAERDAPMELCRVQPINVCVLHRASFDEVDQFFSCKNFRGGNMDQSILGRVTQKIARLGFRQWSLMTEEQLLQGNCFAFAVLWRFVLESHPAVLIRLLESHDWFCVESDDSKLLTSVLRLLQVAFSYRSPLTPAQMVQNKFFAQKSQILLDGIALLQREEKRDHRPVSRSLTRPCRDIHVEMNVNPRVEGALSRLAELDRRRKDLNDVFREPLL